MRAYRTTGVGFMVLMARTSSRDDFSPQGLLENVLTPLITHCQIWPFCTSGSTIACAWGGAAGSAAVSGSGTEAGATVGAAATVATGASVAKVAAVAEAGADVTCVLVAPTGGELGAADLWAEATVMTTAIVATDSPPTIQGSRSVWLFMGGLSSRDQPSAVNINKN